MLATNGEGWRRAPADRDPYTGRTADVMQRARADDDSQRQLDSTHTHTKDAQGNSRTCRYMAHVGGGGIDHNYCIECSVNNATEQRRSPNIKHSSDGVALDAEHAVENPVVGHRVVNDCTLGPPSAAAVRTPSATQRTYTRQGTREATQIETPAGEHDRRSSESATYDRARAARAMRQQNDAEKYLHYSLVPTAQHIGQICEACTPTRLHITRKQGSGYC